MKFSEIKSVRSVLTLAVGLGLLAGVAQAQVKVGFSGVTSGPVGILGQEQYDGFMLGLELLQGKLGGQTATVLKEDDQLRPEIGNQIVRKYLDRDRVDVLVGLGFTNVLMAEMPLITESGIPAIATNAGPAALAGAGCKANLMARLRRWAVTSMHWDTKRYFCWRRITKQAVTCSAASSDFSKVTSQMRCIRR